MTGAKSGSIRSVTRVLDLLRSLNQRAHSTLNDLHSDTGLPKATLHRMLETLRAEGYVGISQRHGLYQLTGKVRGLSDGYTEADKIVEAAIPCMIRKTKAIKWPLAVSTPDGDAMLVRFSTMRFSPLAVQPTSYGHRLSFGTTASGLAYLAFCSDVERRALMKIALGDANPKRGVNASSLVEKLQQVREDGYGLRRPARRGDSATMAVAILRAESAIAVLSLTTFGTTMTRSFCLRYRSVLRETANEIAEVLDAIASIDTRSR